MNDGRQVLTGCATWIGIILVIVAAFRADTVTQFLIMAAILIGGLLFVFWGLGSYSKGGAGNIFLAMTYAYLGVMLLWSGGSFLVTGNYDEAIRKVWKQPAPTAAVQSQPTAIPTQSPNIAQPTSSVTTESTKKATRWQIPPAVKEVWSKLSADMTISQPISEQFEIWRLIMGIILGLQYGAGFYVAKRTRQRNVGRNFFFYGVISILLMFTKIGEWLYQFYMLISGWGILGYIIIAVSIVLIGAFGFLFSMMGFNNTIGYILIGTLCSYIIAGFLYHNVQMLQFCILPSTIILSIVLYFAIYQARYRRYLKFR